jgi:hypothetical protein
MWPRHGVGQPDLGERAQAELSVVPLAFGQSQLLISKTRDNQFDGTMSPHRLRIAHAMHPLTDMERARATGGQRIG